MATYLAGTPSPRYRSRPPTAFPLTHRLPANRQLRYVLTLRNIGLLIGAIVLLAIAATAYLTLTQRPRSETASASVVDYLSARTGAEGFARADRPRAIAFPADAGPHPDYQTEWWYYTGNLEAVDGRRFGFQLTFFRRALAPPADRAQRDSDWAMDQLYLAHFALTDVAGGDYHSADRLARGAAGLAGAEADPFRVWVETWSSTDAAASPPVELAVDATARPAEQSIITSTNRSAPNPRGSVRLVAADGPVAIDLLLSPEKPPVLHGDAGLSPKGPEPGNASYYYSYPRLAADGTLATADGTVPVSGQAWMDHEWSTSALGEDQTGWDWFSLQLDDGRELMVFQLRERDGGIAEASSGSLIDANARVTHLDRADFAIEVKDTWISPRTGGDYPAGWRVTVPGAGLDLTIEPMASDQELDVGFKYWEGAVDVEGIADGRHVSGQGYVELTGYAPSAAGGGLPGAE